jgi:hypothetical protein
MKYLLMIASLSCIGLLPMQAQTVVSGAITSGATNATQAGSYGMQGAFGQPIVGESGVSPVVYSGIMTHAQGVQKYYESTLIEVTHAVKQIGDTFALDVLYKASCALFQSNVTSRNYELKVSFNRTVLEPLRYDSLVDDGERYTITVSGSVATNSGTAARILFMGRLGNDSTTDVRVESFRWIDAQRQYVQSVSGSVTLRGLCNTYGSTRLLKGPATMAVLIAPNPVTGSQFTIRSFSERPAVGTLVVTDIHGNVVHTMHNVEASSAWPMTSVALQILPSGSYTVALYTDNDVARTTMVKLP